jgi:phosphoribosylaminoimidazole-succinocarboxamide synthase
MGPALLQTSIDGVPCRRGKVRDVYDLGDGRLLIVATDRISAFDWVMPNGIPDKGRVLSSLSEWWFERLGARDHRISTRVEDSGLDLDGATRDALAGRTSIVRKYEIIPFECVARGYLAGSGWKEYRSTGRVCGLTLPAGLSESAAIEPIFTPATKATSGHDENVSFDVVAGALGYALANRLRELTLELYRKASAVSERRGLILADTKFEFGLGDDGEPVLVDEALTPDSSRYWPGDGYRAGGPQPSFDKQYVRDWLETTGWDKSSEPPALPDEVVRRTREKYVECYERLTEQAFGWK